MRALDTRSPEVCGSLVLHAIENGVLAIWANNRPETLLVMPPLVIGPAEVDEVIDGIGRAARGGALMLAPDLEALEADVVHAIATGDASRLNVVGHGEISLVLGWPPTNPEVVCKRLPPFPDVAGYQSYRDVVLRYVDELRGRGVHVVDTELRHLVRRDEHVVGFHVQPLLPADRLGTEVLRSGASEDGHSLLEAVVETVDRATDDRLGIDAQLSNWIWLDAVPWQIDLTTPFLLDDNRRPSFDLTPFLAPLPAVARPIVRREMAKLILRWTTSRGALLDLAANLLKEDLNDWLAPALRTINAHVSPPITRGRGGARAPRRPKTLATAVPSRACQPVVAATDPPSRVRLLAPRAHNIRRAPSPRSLRGPETPAVICCLRPELVEVICVGVVDGDLGDLALMNLELDRARHVECSVAAAGGFFLDRDGSLRVCEQVDDLDCERSTAERSKLSE